MGNIVAGHIVHCNPSIIIHIKLLFTMMVSHSYVPESFGVDIIVPVPIDKSGDFSSLDNYIPITLSPVFSKFTGFTESRLSSDNDDIM